MKDQRVKGDSKSGRCSRPPSVRPPLEKDLETPKIGLFHQQLFAQIFQQRMGGRASQGAGSQQDPVDLTGGNSTSCSQDVTSSAETTAPTANAGRGLQFLAAVSI